MLGVSLTMPYCVYILLCKGGTFYTGYTRNVKTRLRMHMNGKGAKYTKIHRPVEIAYTEEFASRTEAIHREKNIKKLNHKQKLQLIRRKSR
jgi:putative endonuclease